MEIPATPDGTDFGSFADYQTPAPPRPPLFSFSQGEPTQKSAVASRKGLPKGPKRQVSSTACLACKRRKSKCDGVTPRCMSCSALYYTVCEYDIDEDKRRKGALRREIQRLKDRERNYQDILEALCQPGADMQKIVGQLRTRSITDIAQSLREMPAPAMAMAQVELFPLFNYGGIEGPPQDKNLPMLNGTDMMPGPAPPMTMGQADMLSTLQNEGLQQALYMAPPMVCTTDTTPFGPAYVGSPYGMNWNTVDFNQYRDEDNHTMV